MQKQEERYEIIKLLGSGATARVYLAYDRLLKRRLAMKWGRERALLRMEAELLAGFSTQFFPALYDYTERERSGLLYMEYIEGENLSMRKKRIECFTEEEALGIAVKIASALACLHTGETPYVYGDLKPENIMISVSGSIKLIDFGAAVPICRKEGPRAGEKRGGTPLYAPPEQWMGRPDVRNDIYALGRLLQDMLKMGRGGMLSRGTRRLIERCVQKQPQKRYSSMEVFLEEAKALLKSL